MPEQLQFSKWIALARRIGAQRVRARRGPFGRNPPFTANRPQSPPLAKLTVRSAVPRPILRKQPLPHVAMKRGMRPIAHLRDEAVLERIDITIFDVARVVGLIADQMLPEPPLPDAAFVACDTNGAEVLPFGSARANRVLISRQRVEKSRSSGGSCQTACR
jgi:hypothetical protein